MNDCVRQRNLKGYLSLRNSIFVIQCSKNNTSVQFRGFKRRYLARFYYALHL